MEVERYHCHFPGTRYRPTDRDLQLVRAFTNQVGSLAVSAAIRKLEDTNPVIRLIVAGMDVAVGVHKYVASGSKHAPLRLFQPGKDAPGDVVATTIYVHGSTGGDNPYSFEDEFSLDELELTPGQVLLADETWEIATHNTF